MDLQISDVEFFVTVGQRISGHLDPIFLFDEPASCLQGQMCPLSQYLRILKNVGNIKLLITYVDRPFYDLASFLFFRNGRNHSVVFDIFLDYLVDS